MASPEAERERSRLFANRKPERQDVAEARAQWEAEALATHILPPGTAVTPVTAGGVDALWVATHGAAANRAILHLHGGGYIAGSPFIYRRFAAYVAGASGLPVLLPDYALAPEHPFPAGVEDALRAYRWLQAEGFPAGRIALVGDSAGGGLVLSLLLMLREAGEAMPGAVSLVSPWTDLTVSSPSYVELAALDPVISQHRLRDAACHYAGERDPADPLLSPLFCSPAGLPAMLIQVGSDERMRDDAVLFAERAQAAGVEVTLQVWPEMWHVFHQHYPEVPEAGEAIQAMADYVSSALA